MTFIETAAEAIINELRDVLGKHVLLTDLEGRVVADSQMRFFGKDLPAVKQAIESGEIIKIPQEQLESGIEAHALSISHEGEKLGYVALLNSTETAHEHLPVARSLAELLIHQLVMREELPSPNKILDQFFHDLLEGEEQGLERLRERSKFLDSHYQKIELDQDRLVMMVEIDGLWQSVLDGGVTPNSQGLAKIKTYRKAIREEIVRFAENNNDVLVVYFSDDYFTVLIGSNNTPEKLLQRLTSSLEQIRQRLTAQFGETVKVALGPYKQGVDGLRTVYTEAGRALKVGGIIFPKKLTFQPDDLILPKALDCLPKSEREKIVDYYLKPLAEDKDLLNTLTVYLCWDMDLKKTAKKLYIHKNTLYYRLKKIKKLLGFDPREFRNAAALLTAIYLYHIDTGEPLRTRSSEPTAEKEKGNIVK